MCADASVPSAPPAARRPPGSKATPVPSAPDGASAGISKPARKKYVLTKRRQYWTDEEHARFLTALAKHGREWKAIERVVETKTAVQIRSHAQKYFLRLERQAARRGESAAASPAARVPVPPAPTTASSFVQAPPARPLAHPLHQVPVPAYASQTYYPPSAAPPSPAPPSAPYYEHALHHHKHPQYGYGYYPVPPTAHHHHHHHRPPTPPLDYYHPVPAYCACPDCPPSAAHLRYSAPPPPYYYPLPAHVPHVPYPAAPVAAVPPVPALPAVPTPSRSAPVPAAPSVAAVPTSAREHAVPHLRRTPVIPRAAAAMVPRGTDQRAPVVERRAPSQRKPPADNKAGKSAAAFSSFSLLLSAGRQLEARKDGAAREPSTSPVSSADERRPRAPRAPPQSPASRPSVADQTVPSRTSFLSVAALVTPVDGAACAIAKRHGVRGKDARNMWTRPEGGERQRGDDAALVPVL